NPDIAAVDNQIPLDLPAFFDAHITAVHGNIAIHHAPGFHNQIAAENLTAAALRQPCGRDLVQRGQQDGRRRGRRDLRPYRDGLRLGVTAPAKDHPYREGRYYHGGAQPTYVLLEPCHTHTSSSMCFTYMRTCSSAWVVLRSSWIHSPN